MTSGPRFVRRLAQIAPGARAEGTAGTAGELWFVIDGTGRLEVDDHPGLSLRQDRGIWIPAGARYRVDADGPAELRFDAVTLPAVTLPAVTLPAATLPAATLPAAAGDPADRGSRAGADCGAPPSGPPLARDLGDCEVETTGDRRFRVLFGPGRGCSVATQFAGEIPTGRAPEHSHPYDELVLVLAGQGVLHLGGAERALSPGTSAHLPPGQLHCLENTGTTTMRVLGVFHPADSPAAKAHVSRS
jgi:quercetin dioxygenase-like cupin family protein